jgi:hypothetical protein
MALEVFQDMFKKEELTDTKILQSLLMSDKHLSMKTRISEPIAMTLFDVSALRFQHKNMPKCARLILAFARMYKENMVSYPDGEGRKEITTAIAGAREQEKNLGFTERLMGMRRE